MKSALLLLCLLFVSFCSSQAQTPFEYTPDEDIDQYLEKSYLLNKNAVYLNGSDIFGSGTAFIGYQRALIKGFWAEVGIGIGIGEIQTKPQKVNAMREYATPLRYLFSSNIEDIEPIRDYEDVSSYGAKSTSAFEFGVFKKIVGLPLSGQWSIGVTSRIANYDINYQFRDKYSNTVSSTNTMKRNSFYAVLLYKMEVRRNLGIGYTIGAGPSMMSFGSTTLVDDPYSDIKFTAIDYFGSLRFYFTF